MKLFVAILLLLTCTAWSQNCEQIFTPIPNDVDANLIAIDPSTGQRLFLGRVQARTNVAVTITGSMCDPEGDEARVWLLETGSSPAKELPIDPNDGTYTLTLIFTNPGRYYRTIGAADAVDTREGTFVVDVITNTPPALGPVTAVSGDGIDRVISLIRARQASLQRWAKRTGLPLVTGLVMAKAGQMALFNTETKP